MTYINYYHKELQIISIRSKQKLNKKQQPVVTGLGVASFTNQFYSGLEQADVNTTSFEEGINSGY